MNLRNGLLRIGIYRCNVPLWRSTYVSSACLEACRLVSHCGR